MGGYGQVSIDNGVPIKQTNSVVSVRKANYTDRATAACRRS
jgi:hypothetical protein